MPSRRRPGTRPADLPTSIAAAVYSALHEYGMESDSDRLLGRVMEALALDADAAGTGRDRAAAVKSLLEVADRLDLVPPIPGRAAGGGTGRAAPLPAGPAAAGPAGPGEPEDNPFGVPGTWPRLVDGDVG